MSERGAAEALLRAEGVNVYYLESLTNRVAAALAAARSEGEAAGRAEAVALLEWTDDDAGYTQRCCWCGHSREHGHSRECRLAEVIRALGGAA